MSEGCEAQKSGVDVDESGGACGSSATFECGSSDVCAAGKQYCVSKGGGASFACAEFGACSPDCSCASIDKTCTCTEKIAGQVRVDCPL